MEFFQESHLPILMQSIENSSVRATLGNLPNILCEHLLEKYESGPFVTFAWEVLFHDIENYEDFQVVRNIFAYLKATHNSKYEDVLEVLFCSHDAKCSDDNFLLKVLNEHLAAKKILREIKMQESIFEFFFMRSSSHTDPVVKKLFSYQVVQLFYHNMLVRKCCDSSYSPEEVETSATIFVKIKAGEKIFEDRDEENFAKKFGSKIDALVPFLLKYRQDLLDVSDWSKDEVLKYLYDSKDVNKV